MENKLFIPQDFLEQCLGLQEVIASVPPDQKRQAGADAKQMILEKEVAYKGAHKLELHTNCAYALPDDLTLESQIWPMVYYPTLRMKAWLGNIAFISFNQVNTLAWMMVDPVIRDSAQAISVNEASSDPRDESTVPLPLNEKLIRPLYVPVGMIESVFIAA